MARIISIHSFRRGTGKTNITANLAALLARQGRRVAIIDSDVQSPTLHTLFKLRSEQLAWSLHDYLWGRCDLIQTAHDVTANEPALLPGRVFLVPFAIKPVEPQYELSLLSDSFQSLVEGLGLDALLIDSAAGITQESLPALSLSDVQVIVLRPDEQDYQGTGVTVDVARHLGVPCLLIINQVPAAYDQAAVRVQVERVYQQEVIAVLPHAEAMGGLGSAEIFVARYPDHPLTTALDQAARRLVA